MALSLSIYLFFSLFFNQSKRSNLNFLPVTCHTATYKLNSVQRRSIAQSQCRINAVIVDGMLIIITLLTPMPMGIKPMPKTIHQVQNYRIPYRQRRPRHCLSHHLYRQQHRLLQQLQQVTLHKSVYFFSHHILFRIVVCLLLFTLSNK